MKTLRICCLLALLLSTGSAFTQNNTGMFTRNSDVGAVLHPGTARYDAKTQSYLLSGSGANIWFGKDEFHYLWRRIKGDFILQARGRFIGQGADPHRKIGWMVRSSLDTDAPMACVAVHGDGLASLQYRRQSGSDVEEVRSSAAQPDVMQLERRGQRFILSVARWGEPFSVEELPALNLGDEVYAGLFICSHNPDVVEQASFDNVRIVFPAGDGLVPYRDYLGSYLETMDIESGRRKILYTSNESLQAPNWTPDGKCLLYNSNGLIYRFRLSKGKPKQLNTGTVTHNNNDHVISFDGRQLGLSSSSGEPEYGSLIYTVPIKGGIPRRVTPTGPSYLHSWSPDGRYLLYTAGRNGQYDIYRIPVGGGREEQLTGQPRLDDGPEYSPDGKYIYFNSARTGAMQLWRMKADGSEPEQFTFDENYNDWFPHFSPDGKWIVFISYGTDVKAEDHPFYKHVYLRLMPAAGGQPKVIAYLYGGQGTINTPSWSPDGKRIAFVSNSGDIISHDEP